MAITWTTRGQAFRWIACLITLALSGTAAADRQIVMLNWSDYVAPPILEQFTRKTGIVVRQVYFSSDEDRDSIIAQADPGDFDVVLINGAKLELFRRQGWLKALTTDDVPNLRHIEDRWLDAYPAAYGFAVPYFWGSVGIAYRSDLVAQPITSWMQVFRPGDDLCEKIPMPPDSRLIIDLALLALGYETASPGSAELEAARQVLLEQQACVTEYLDPDINRESELVTGDIAAAILYNGDAHYLAGIDPRIEFVVPGEGTVLWVDYFAVPASSRNADAAYAFLDFLNRPDVAARHARSHNFATPNAAAQNLLPAEFVQDPWIHPPQSLIESSAFEAVLPARTQRRYNAIGHEILSIAESAQ